MNKYLLIVFLIIGCAPTTQNVEIAPYRPGDFELGMTIEDFKRRNTGLEIYKAVADTVIYTRWEKLETDGGNQIGYLFFNGKLFEVKRFMK